MKKPFMALAIILQLCIFLSLVSAEIYQWTDKNGNMVFSDSPPQGKDARIKKFEEDRIFKAAPGEKGAKQEDSAVVRSSENEQRRKKSYGDIDVIMYMTNWCGYCKKAREYINSLGASLTEYDIDRDGGKKEEMQRKSGGSTGVPVIDVEGIIIKGYNPDAIKNAVEKRRSL